MPRQITGATESESFRIVATTVRTYSDGRTTSSTTHYGPYTKVGTARSVLTRERTSAAYWQKHMDDMRTRFLASDDNRDRQVGIRIDGRIERSSIKWEAVEENANG